MTRSEYATNQWLYDNGHQDGVAFVYKKLADKIQELEKKNYEDDEIYSYLKAEILVDYLKDVSVSNNKL